MLKLQSYKVTKLQSYKVTKLQSDQVTVSKCQSVKVFKVSVYKKDTDYFCWNESQCLYIFMFIHVAAIQHDVA